MLRKVVSLSVVGCVVALAVASLSMAQPQGGPGGMRGNFDPERMQQMMQERMREQLGATAEEWKILGPRVTKVMTLSRQAGGGMRMGRMFMGRGRGPGGQGAPGGPGGPNADSDRGNRGNRGNRGDRPQRPRGGMLGETSPVDTAADELQTTLENASATPEEIKGKLTALRTAKEKAKQELAVAQKDLREVLTLRQEAQLVVMGLLD